MDDYEKCPDCGLSYFHEKPEKHVNNCPLGVRRVVSSERGLKTYKNQSVCVSVLDRSVNLEEQHNLNYFCPKAKKISVPDRCNTLVYTDSQFFI